MLVEICLWLCFFFFKQKTAYDMRMSDWSSDVCSSDLNDGERREQVRKYALCGKADGDAANAQSRHQTSDIHAQIIKHHHCGDGEQHKGDDHADDAHRVRQGFA